MSDPYLILATALVALAAWAVASYRARATRTRQLALLAAVQRTDQAGQLQASVDGAAQRISHGKAPR